jgi:hypothetical protein
MCQVLMQRALCNNVNSDHLDESQVWWLPLKRCNPPTFSRVFGGGGGEVWSRKRFNGAKPFEIKSVNIYTTCFNDETCSICLHSMNRLVSEMQTRYCSCMYIPATKAWDVRTGRIGWELDSTGSEICKYDDKYSGCVVAVSNLSAETGAFKPLLTELELSENRPQPWGWGWGWALPQVPVVGCYEIRIYRTNFASNGGRSVGIVRSRTKATELVGYNVAYGSVWVWNLVSDIKVGT